MEDAILTIEPEKRWEVIFQDPECWRVGIYKPEFKSPDEIQIIEKHTCPELFVCQRGRMGLLLSEGADAKNERVIRMEPNQAILVTDYHNGFSIDPDGYFLVVERTIFKTEYIER